MACYQKKGYIYKLYRPGIDDIYIGYTFISLSQKMKSHYQDYKMYTMGKRCYRTSNELVKHDDCKIKLLEECYCNNREELKNRQEVYKIKCGKNCINLYNEYYLDNYDVIMKYLKLYYQGNYNTSLKNNRQHYQGNSDTSLKNNRQHYQNFKDRNKNKKHIKSNLSRLLEKERNKQYYIDNREKLLERYKQYYKDNRGLVKERNKLYRENNYHKKKQEKIEKILCDCGIYYSKYHGSRHKRSNRHNEIMNKMV